MGISDNALPALLIILGINLMLFFGQLAMTDINPSGSIYYNVNGSLLCQYDKNSCASDEYIIDDEDAQQYLPSGESSVSATTGNIFTDAFTSIKGWFAGILGIKYITAFLFAPANFIKSLIFLPQAFQWALGAIWYGATFFVIIALLWGR